MPAKTPRLAQALRVRQIRLTAAQIPLRPPEVINVRVGAEPFDDATVSVALGFAAKQEPAIGSVEPSQADLELYRTPVARAVAH